MDFSDFKIGSISTLDTELNSSVKSLYKHKQLSPEQIKSTLTYLFGNSGENMTPILLLTEGNGITVSKSPAGGLNDTSFYHDVIGNPVHTFKVLGLVNPANTKPGFGNSDFEVYVETNLLHIYWGAISPSGMYQIRAQEEPRSAGNNRYIVKVSYISGSKTSFIDPNEFINDQYWSASAPTIPLGASGGTASNRRFPGKMKGQWGAHRYSMNIEGNIANKVVNIQLPVEGGGYTNAWLPWEFTEFENDRRLMREYHLWKSKYNRTPDGKITTIDEKSGRPVPYTAGMEEIIMSSGNYSTYSTLTMSKLNNTYHSTFSNRIDNTPMEIVLITGDGGALEFDRAIKYDAKASSYYQRLGETEIRSGGKYLSYGSYFNQYKMYNGSTITVMVSPYFNNGPQAEMDRKNGNMVGAFPASSMDLVFVDVSATDDGGRNLTLVHEKGRELITKIYKGMSPLPKEWAAMGDDKFVSTKDDIASYEAIETLGLAMINNTTSFYLKYQK